MSVSHPIEIMIYSHYPPANEDSAKLVESVVRDIDKIINNEKDAERLSDVRHILHSLAFCLRKNGTKTTTG